MPAARATIAPRNLSDVEMLVELVRDSLRDAKKQDDEKQDAALSAVAALCSLAGDAELRKMIGLAGGIEVLVTLSRDGTKAQKAKAASALRMLAYKDQDNKKWMGEAQAIEPLVALLAPCGADGDAAANSEVCEMAAAALCNLAHVPELRTEIAQAGAIERLVALLTARGTRARRGTCMTISAVAAAALNNLAVDNDANKAAIGQAGAIPPLVHLARDGTEWQRRQAEGGGSASAKGTMVPTRPSRGRWMLLPCLWKGWNGIAEKISE